MLSKKDLQLRLKEKKPNISTAEVHELMDGFNTPIMDICYACEVSKPTMDIYLGENTTALPKKHKKTIIKFYLDLYENGEEPEIKEPEDPDVVDYADIPEEDAEKAPESFEIEFTPDKEGPVTVNVPEDEEESAQMSLYHDITMTFDQLVSCPGCDNAAQTLYPHPESSYEKPYHVCEECFNQAKEKPAWSTDIGKPIGNGVREIGNDITPEAQERLEKKFKHLDFEKIVFRPKNGDLGEALLEALKYSRQAGIPVHVRNGDKLIKLCEQ